MTSVIKVSQQLTRLFPEVFDYVENGYTEKFVAYITNSKYRRAVELKPWIKAQVSAAPTQPLIECDAVMINILNRSIKTRTYISDKLGKWKMLEYWQTAQETRELKEGDCEDVANEMYVEARNAGVPANRLMLMTGDVEDPLDHTNVVGHCWLAYRPDEYPLNWVFLDWCFWPTTRLIGSRDFYYMNGTSIYRTTPDGNALTSKYRKLWFAFNENKSYLSFTRRK